MSLALSPEYEKKRELEDRTTEALILGFRKPIYQDYNVPSPHKIEQAVGIALADLCGIDKNDRWRIFHDGIVWDLHHPERLQERVRQGLYDIFSGCRDENNSIDMYMMTFHKLDWIWVYMLGDVFKFKPGDRKKAEERVKAYWNTEELQNFGDINKITRRFINKGYKRRANLCGVGNVVVR